MRRFAQNRPGVAAVALLLLGLAGCGGGSSVSPGTSGTMFSSPTAEDADIESIRPLLLDAGRVSQLPELPADEPLLIASEGAMVGLDGARGGTAGSACVAWNEIARALVARYGMSPPISSRAYALLSVAQHDVLAAARIARHPARAPRLAPPRARALVASSSAAVLSYLYPGEADWLAAKAEEYGHPGVAGAALDRFGRAVARWVIRHAEEDGSDAVWTGTAPAGPGVYYGDNPLLPLWGEVRPWMMTSGSEFRAAPPPAFGSPEFLAALQEVRHYSDTRTPEQLRIAVLWDDGPGTYTATGPWNRIACQIIERRHLDEARSARVLALLNIAMMDAGIAAWETKYHYWLIRPWQADPAITVPIWPPSFPAYTSGHSAFGGAAEMVLGRFFPTEAASLHAMSEENAISRVYGGVHYRFDCAAGLAQGRAVGALALRKGLGSLLAP